MIMPMGLDYVSELRTQRAYCSSPRSYISMENHGGMTSMGETPDSTNTALWQSYQQCYLVANQEELGEGNDEFSLRSIFVNTSK
jgi:hypothetical protein